MQPRKLVHGARAVIAVSEHTKLDIIEQYGVAPEKVRVVYPGIAQSQDVTNGLGPTNETNIRAIRGASVASPFEKFIPFILYLGTLEPRKNIEGLIQDLQLPGAASAFLRHL